MAEELGEIAPELKLSLFQLGISPQIAASIVMQVKLLIPWIIGGTLTGQMGQMLDYYL